MNERTTGHTQSLLDRYTWQDIWDETLRRWPGIEHDPELQRKHLPEGTRLDELRKLARGESMTLEQWHAEYGANRARHDSHPHGTRYAHVKRWANGRRVPYDPWFDLAFRMEPRTPFAPTVLGIEWFPYKPSGNLGHTIWNERRIHLSSGLSEAELRTTLTHELIHLERGLVPRQLKEAEEDAVELLTAQRLIDPDDFDAGSEARALGVDQPALDVYASWRARVDRQTAHDVWESVTWGFPR